MAGHPAVALDPRGDDRAGLVWRRPRPVVGPSDPQKRCILPRIKRLLQHLPASETAVFPEEADRDLNPEIGSLWPVNGQPTEIVTPGNNVKRDLSGSVDGLANIFGDFKHWN